MTSTNTSLAQQADTLQNENESRITFSCHCKTLYLSVPSSPPPSYINACQCSICRRYAAAWAYYDITQVKINKAGTGLSRPGDGSQAYTCHDKTAQFVRCENCGNLMYWWSFDAEKTSGGKMGVNTRCVDDGESRKILEGVEVRGTFSGW